MGNLKVDSHIRWCLRDLRNYERSGRPHFIWWREKSTQKLVEEGMAEIYVADKEKGWKAARLTAQGHQFAHEVLD